MRLYWEVLRERVQVMDLSSNFYVLYASMNVKSFDAHKEKQNDDDWCDMMTGVSIVCVCVELNPENVHYTFCTSCNRLHIPIIFLHFTTFSLHKSGSHSSRWHCKLLYITYYKIKPCLYRYLASERKSWKRWRIFKWTCTVRLKVEFQVIFFNNGWYSFSMI